ncbi:MULTISPECIES: 16S rRNA (guanine(966)-N(2))-methyltransferase RsmD [Anaerococcus]|jgi:RNA methyltransferase, rsmD family|uniref:16S rRNA (Guanine(966)-N(2))-methyltransferase RsmD n=2 Tax=Anaerococcus octavius TaxID=54007 RepID=A0A2I1M9J3_9FIRM|nr:MULTISPECIES: 16S rRNA (guanine(966)-N(2))-methyltransferase RsmD [Anaerococcus]MBS6105844.1 16S rRNA (guanine(966)-N(2))-methyltransferase RsmD [Anaerococcus sp.]MDU5229214.1 16S rRNA (guanine(966)-N(2))-methyltransferase RsmD [Anaerococcus sp.]MDU7411562.1 16S rRNA (guanine(966)-N(2))-methyltransferase RsmD [Anaerococcus sp.]PKZ16812.1 16S rRNA (guanine(966)-N(2))-methyltransferase RsmD [Anaerococcus octavius]
MRVVAGKYKGFNLMAPKGKNTRPTDNKIKEAIFDMLYPIKTNGNALDLFAGSGQMGIEFLSRGLEKVYFNESDRNSFRVLKENIEKIKDDNYELSKLDFKMALENYKNQGIKFDYIFLDPPYAEDFIKTSLDLILNYELLNEDGIVITESDRYIEISDTYDLYLVKEKNYGRKIVKIYIK